VTDAQADQDPEPWKHLSRLKFEYEVDHDDDPDELLHVLGARFEAAIRREGCETNGFSACWESMDHIGRGPAPEAGPPT